MKNIYRVVCIAAASSLLFSCSVKEDDLFSGGERGNVSEVFGEGLPEESLLKEMNIKVDDDMALSLDAATGGDGFVDMDAVPSLKAQGVVSMRRLFPSAGEFEQRTREAGLHRWYVLGYDESRSMTKASAGLMLPGVEEIEYCPKIEIIGSPAVTEYVAVPSAASASGNNPFDDPMLSQQWHYYNNGSASSSVSGCDINVFPVWRNLSTYSSYRGDIIVGVVDGGIDYTHEDLKDNMWHNPEKTGNNVYGYNFASNSFNIHAEDHGTHVAGTVAAVNDNGVGVCGVAGGDSRKNIKGAKLMSCQIFDGDKQGSGAEAIKWSADHGAVISQNSWGYVDMTSTPSSLKDAVDYFIRNAGLDKNGNQTGPMRGGLVIFAAGNDNKTTSGNDYEKILNVSSVGADYKRAYYTNYGSWCDVSAPGGDAKKGNQVLSTLPGNKYGKMQGTSMACPHVSGMAALLLSRYGGSGYTPDALRKRIEDNVTDISAQNPGYYLGKGLVNVYKAMAGSGGKAPDMPTGLQVAASSNNISFNVTIPRDSDDGKPSAIYVYYSKSDFTTVKDAMFGMFYVEDLAVGDVLSGEITGVEFNTEYYVAAQACDLAGNMSALTSRVRVTTGGNNPPQIVAAGETEFVLKPHESAVAAFDIVEPDGHYFDLVLDPGSEAAVLDTLVRESPKIRITASAAPTGKYEAKLTVTDYYGLAASAVVKYEILENHAPTVVKEFSDIVFASRAEGTMTLEASDYFNDEDGEELSYTFTFSNSSVANMTYSKGQFLLTPMTVGSTEITVTGQDVRGESVESSLRVFVADSSRPVSCYPSPVQSVMSIRVNREYASVHVKVVSSAGGVFFDGGFGNVTPFEPLKIDMGAASPGAYTVVVTLDGEVHKINVVKI